MLTGSKRWLLNPWVILLGIAVGITIGLTNNPLHGVFKQLGNIYLQLLQMCIFPTVVTAVIVSVGNLLHSHITDYIRRLALVFVIGTAIVAVISISASIFIHSFANLNAHSQVILGKKLAEIQSQVDTSGRNLEFDTIWNFINNIIATNIFRSLSDGDSLSVLIFCILLGTALGFTKSKAAKIALSTLDGFYSALLKLVDWLMYALPFGLCFMFGGLVSEIGFDVLIPLGKLILLFAAIGFWLVIINGYILAKRTGCSFFQAIKAIKAPIFIALGTSSSFAALPTTLQSLEQGLKFDRKVIGLIIPIGVNFYQLGSILKYTLVVFFIAHLYNSHIGLAACVTIYFTVILMSIAGSGAPGIAAVSMFAIMLEPLGLPVLPGIALLTMLDPLIDPLVTVVNVVGNCTAASLVIPQEDLYPYLSKKIEQEEATL